MKSIVFLLVTIYAPQSLAAAEVKTPVSVSAFKNKSSTSYADDSGCHYWGWFSDLGDAFAETLAETLHKYPKYEVLERSQIHNIYENEVELVNSSKDTSIKKGEFRKAKITFVGVVDGFEFCQGGTSVGIDVGGFLGLGSVTPKIKSSSASISLMIRAVDTTTGKILATARSKKSQDRGSLGLDISTEGFSATARDFKQSMLGETIREAIDEAASELVKKI